MDYNTSNASGSQAGGLYQPVVALNVLITKLTHANARVGIEVLDDVTIDDQGHISLGQVKHTINEEENPLNDLNKNLWKTLAIWLSYIRINTPSVDEFSLLLYTNGNVGKKTLIEEISDAYNDTEIDSVIIKMNKCTSKDKDVQKLINEVRKHTNEHLKQLIKAIKLIRVDQPQESGLEADSISSLAVPDDCDKISIYNEVLGWFTKLVYESWKNKKEAWVTRAQLNNQVIACLELRGIFGGAIGIDEIDMPLSADNSSFYQEKFVRHLKLVDIKDPAINTAINNSLKYQRTRVNSVKSGKISYKFWEYAESLLQNDWDNAKQEVENLASPVDSEDRKSIGRKIYFKTIQRESKILNREFVQHVVPGLYHALANTDKVWWHPDYPNIHDSEN